MSYCTLNGERVLRGTLTFPRLGVWHGDLVVDTKTKLDGPVTVGFGDGALIFKGTIVRGDVFQNTYSCKIVGGAASLSTIVPAKYYQGAPLGLALRDLLAECGETLSPLSDAATLGRLLPKWCRNKGPGAQALSDLVDPTDAVWRVLADGSIFVGPERWPELDVPHALLARDPSEGRFTVATELPVLRPGVVFNKERISAVTHSIAPDRVRTEAWTERNSLLDRLKGPLTALIRSVMRHVDYHRPFPARVVQQDGDGTLHVVPDSDEIPGLTGVPIRYGIPGVTAKVPAGARCIIEFENGDPTAPVATAFEPGALKELSFDGGSRRIAREGEPVDVGMILVTKSGGVVGDVRYFSASVDSVARDAAYSAASATASTSGATVDRIDLVGSVAGGADRIRA